METITTTVIKTLALKVAKAKLNPNDVMDQIVHANWCVSVDGVTYKVTQAYAKQLRYALSNPDTYGTDDSIPTF
jgi:hypothetical protein